MNTTGIKRGAEAVIERQSGKGSLVMKLIANSQSIENL